MIQVWRGEIEEAAAEAVLRPVGIDLEAITPISRRLELAAGEDLQERLRTMGPIPVGGAVVTPGGDLPFMLMIHAVLQSPTESTSEFAVQQALLNGLRRACEWGIHTLALPPLGTGAGNLDAETAASLMVPIMVHHMSASGCPDEVTIVTSNDYEEGAFRQEVRRAVLHISRDEP